MSTKPFEMPRLHLKMSIHSRKTRKVVTVKRSYSNSVGLLPISILCLTASIASAQITFPNLPYPVSVSDGQNNGHTMCYNPTRNEYLIAYMSFPSTSRRVIQYFRLDSTGTKIGGPVDVVDNLEGSSGPSVCYNSAHQEYLISYQGFTSAGGLHSELRIQRVNAINGALISGSTWIKNSPTVIVTKVSYSPTSDSYLLVWEDQVDVPWPVYGLRLNGTAGAIGSSFHISNGAYKYAGDPAIAYNSVNNEYLILFSTYLEPDPGNTCWNLYAQRVRASDGVLLGGNFAIGATTECESNSNIAYDSNLNRYLVVYEGGVASPWGQFVSDAGTLVGARFDIGTGAFKGGMSNVAWNSLTREWFVTWASCCSADNYALRLTQAGAAIGSPTQTNGTVQGTGNWDPTPVYNSANNEMLICWFWQYAVVYNRRAQAGFTQTSVTINLGFANIEDLMTSPIGGDGDTVGVANIGGHECRQNMDPAANDWYFYFTVNDGWAYQGNKQDVWIYCEYYDNATTGSITLNYDAVSSAYKDGGAVWLTGTNTWKTQKWHVTDAYFGNRENNGGDFRIYVGNVVRYLDNHTVNQNTPSTTPPGQSSNPSPANGATGVSITPTLTWTAGANATAHNVFFGTTNPPPFAVVQTTTSYAPGTLTAGTTYYWRIDEYRSGGGTTNGNVWSFTVGGTPPGPAINPNPANGATGVGITSTLSWTAGSGATSHDVRFGTANPPPFIQNQAGTTYNPGTTSPSTTYYWRIDEKNAAGTTTGTVWSYATAAPPNAPSVTAPSNGGTVTTLTPTITWSGDAHDQYQVRVSQQNDSNTSTNGYDSGTVTSTGSSQVSGTLRNFTFYFVFVRLHTAAGGWGNWSAAGYNCIVNTDSTIGTVYLGNALLSASSWAVYDGTCENCTGITTSIMSDGGSNVEQLIDASTSNRSKLKYAYSNVSFDTGASVASRMRVTGVTGTPTYNLGISNGNVGGMFLRLETGVVSLVDINGNIRGTYAQDCTVYHKYQLTVKNTTAGNNATAAWKVYVDGTQRITWTGAGVDNGYDGFMAGHAGTTATGTWWFDNISARDDGEFSPSQWDPVY